jgi:hypothetical protein
MLREMRASLHLLIETCWSPAWGLGEGSAGSRPIGSTEQDIWDSGHCTCMSPIPVQGSHQQNW